MESVNVGDESRTHILRKTPTRENAPVPAAAPTQPQGSPPHLYPTMPPGGLIRSTPSEDSIATLKQNSFLSTNRMSDVQSGSVRDENNFESYLPIIKRLPNTEADLNLGQTSNVAFSPGENSPASPSSPRTNVHGQCSIHTNKSLKYYDISSPTQKLCSKCVVELVVEKNFNAAMTKEEFQKKKQTEDFLTNLSVLSTDLTKIQDKIGRDIEELEKNHTRQKAFLGNLFSQLSLMVEEVQVKYTTRVDKTFQSIREIFNEKINKLSKFEKEMKELEKDVRLNYSNIIRLMDLEPFYEIIYRYNKKLNNIKSVFTEFKGKPDEIPEEAIRVKGIKSQLSFVSGFGRRLESYFADGDSFNSNNSSIDGQELSKDHYPPFLEAAKHEVFRLDNISILGMPQRPQTKIGLPIAIQTDSKPRGLSLDQLPERLSKCIQTDKTARERERDDDLKAQAEILIRSVDTLISSKEQPHPLQIIPLKELSVEASVSLGLTKSPQHSNGGFNQPTLSFSPGVDQRPSKTITKSEIAKRIQAHFNTSASGSKGRSTSSNSAAKQQALAVFQEESSVSKSASLSQQSHGAQGKVGSGLGATRGNSTGSNGHGMVNTETTATQAASKSRLGKNASGQMSTGHLGQGNSFGSYGVSGGSGYQGGATPLASMIKSTSGGFDRNGQLLGGKAHGDRHVSGSSSTKTEKLLMLYRKNKGPSTSGLSFGFGSHPHTSN